MSSAGGSIFEVLQNILEAIGFGNDGDVLTSRGPNKFPTFQVASGGGVTLEDEGVAIANNPHTTINFEGAGVTVVGAPGIATVTIPGGSKWQQISVTTLTDDTEKFIALPSGFDFYRMHFLSVIPSAASQLRFQFSTDGLTVDATNYVYTGIRHRSGSAGSATFESANATFIPHSSNSVNTAGAGVDGHMSIFNANTAARTMRIAGEFAYRVATLADIESSEVAGRQDSLSIFTHLHIAFGAGNLASGTIILEGYDST